MIRGHLRRRRHESAPTEADPDVVEIDARALTGVFATPAWLRDLGFSAWLLVGVTLLIVSAVWLLSLTQTIVGPVIVAGVVASVLAPLVSWVGRHMPRALATALVLLLLVALGAGFVLLIVGGVTSESGDIGAHLDDAKSKLEGWAKDLGVSSDQAQDAKNDASSSVTKAVETLLNGLSSAISQLSSLVFFLALTTLSLFFMLKDGPLIRRWGERHLGIPAPVAHTIVQRVLQSLRGYFLGVTYVALFNAVVVGGGALLLGVPLAGTIAIVTFAGAYIPYLGAWGAGAFSVLIALGGAGTDAAAGMIVVQLLANGILQQLIQPIAYGAALGIHPLAVLVVTIAGGCLFGAVGLILFAPLTAAITKITADLARAREAEAAAEARAEPEPPDPAAAPTTAGT